VGRGEPGPGADVGRGEPGPGADLAGPVGVGVAFAPLRRNVARCLLWRV
jgi:hypothetical protein